MRYAVVIEKADGNYSAYVPDLPGCVAAGASVKKSKRKSAKPFDFTSTDCGPMGNRCRSQAGIAEYVET